MWILIVIILALVGFDLAAMLWGVDSRESSQNLEWGRPQSAGPLLFPCSAGAHAGGRRGGSISSQAR